MALPVAHAGHWLPYVIPALVVLAAVVVTSVRERRRREAADEERDSDVQPSD